VTPEQLPQLLEYGVHGLIVIVLLIGWYERREMRKENNDLLREVLKLKQNLQRAGVVEPDEFDQ